MKYTTEELDRMNRSGQRRGSVGSKPTVCTRALLDMAGEAPTWRDKHVLDFGAGKWAQQAAILRHEGFEHVTPYDIGKNGQGEVTPGHDVVLISNVLNVQPGLRGVHAVLRRAHHYASTDALMVCNLPREPLYGDQRPAEVAAALKVEEWDILQEAKYSGGTLWICRAR